MDHVLVFDIGGTSIRSAIYNNKEGLKDIRKEESCNFINNAGKNINQLQNELESKILFLKKLYDNKYGHIKKVGISFPGPINENNEIISAPTLWGNLMNQPYALTQSLEQKELGVEFYIQNDITAAGYRYINKNLKNFCILTVSSGVGNKIFWDGEVLLNSNGYGGEIGHLTYHGIPESMICDCGEKGHIGAMSSGRGVERLSEFLKFKKIELYNKSVLKKENKITTYDLVDAVHQEDAYALYVLRQSIKPIAHIVATVYNLIGIDRFIIIGGFSIAIGDKYVDLLKEEISKLTLYGGGDHELEKMIYLGVKDDNHGLIGIGKYVLANQKVLQNI